LPTPGQPAGLLFRPVIPVRVRGPRGSQVVLALVDTGSDVTVLPAFLLERIGAEVDAAAQAQFRGVGGQLVTAHYSQVELALEQAEGASVWPATVEIGRASCRERG